MDPDVVIMYSVPKGEMIPRDKLKVNLSDRFNRKHLPRPLEQSIDAVWEERMKTNPRLWNGTKFRIDSVTVEGSSPIFNLGITSYKDFIGTNWSPNAKQLHELGGQEHNNCQVFMSDALGVGALVHTSDDFAILLRRSQHCGEAVGLLDIPGGHPEPEELVGKLDASQIDLASLNPRNVVDEIFNSIRREICDEVNLNESDITDPLLIGIARNTTSAGRPSSEYYVRCSLDSAEVQARYQKGDHSEAEESTAIVMVPMTDVLHLQDNHILWKDMAPSAKGCIILYQLAMGTEPTSIAVTE